MQGVDLNLFDIILIFAVIYVVAHMFGIIVGVILEAFAQLTWLLAWVGVIALIIYLFLKVPN